MESATEYLNRTESAVRILFEGIESYTSLLKEAAPSIFISSSLNRSNAEFDAWYKKNEPEIKGALQAQRQYFAENFALAILCGSVLQVASKAIEMYSRNRTVPDEWAHLIKSTSKAALYCIGRTERRVPLGLIILAGRNQHMHLDEEELREPNPTIFARLASHLTVAGQAEVRDPAFDLDNELLVSFAHNITALIGWRSYDIYKRDMRELLPT